MNSSRLWTLVSVLLIVALVAGTWFIGISPKLDEVSVAEESRATVEMQNIGHTNTLRKLVELDARLPELEAERDALRVAIPNAVNQNAFFRQIQVLAASNAVSVTSITFTPPERFVPAEGALTNPELAGPSASVSADNFLMVTVSLEVEGPRGNVTAFLSALQRGSRLFLAHDVLFPSGLGDPAGESAATITGQIFVLLDPSQVPAVTDADGAAIEGEVAAE